MQYLVIGGTGTVGSQVVSELAARKHQVKVLTRSADKAKSLAPGASPVAGDIADPRTLRSVFAGADGVFMLNAVSTTETHEGLMALNGAMAAGIKRFVYMSVHRMDEALHLPHFGSKLPIETVLKGSGMPFTILRPNNFFQNDYWYKDAMLQYGVYPQPIGDRGLSRVDVRDIAEAAAIALTQPGHEGKTMNLVGPKALTGSATAEIWSRALGKKIAYGGNDLDAWEQQALKMMPAWMVFDMKMMYRFFQEKGLLATDADVAAQTKLLGHGPRGFEAFTNETAKAWAAGVAV